MTSRENCDKRILEEIHTRVSKIYNVIHTSMGEDIPIMLTPGEKIKLATIVYRELTDIEYRLKQLNEKEE